MLHARGVITRAELDAAARDAGQPSVQLEWTRQEIARAGALIVEIEARQRLASLPPPRPGQYEATDALIRFAGCRSFSPAQLGPLEQFFTMRAGRRLQISAAGQTDLHTRLGLDHRDAIDLALHPDSAEAQLVMSWLREQRMPFMAFRDARPGAATGAHIHVGAPSERVAAAATRANALSRSSARSRPAADARAESNNRAAPSSRPAPPVPATTTQVLTR